MPIPNRKPTALDALRSLREFGVPIGSILDVGVLFGTPPLIRTFPDLSHQLFEPMDEYYEKIHGAYENISHDLHKVAIADCNGVAWQLGLCRNGKGKVTHSILTDNADLQPAHADVLRRTEIRKATLDSLMEGIDVKAPYLLKIDIDGGELAVLRGAKETLKNCSVVMIEVTNRTFAERMNAVVDAGFSVFDIVDQIYYTGTFYQADVLFVRTDIVEKTDALRPMQVKPFDRSQWYPV